MIKPNLSLRLWRRRGVLVCVLLALAVLTALYYIEGAHQQVPPLLPWLTLLSLCWELSELCWDLHEFIIHLSNSSLRFLFLESWLLCWVCMSCVSEVGRGELCYLISSGGSGGVSSVAEWSTPRVLQHSFTAAVSKLLIVLGALEGKCFPESWQSFVVPKKWSLCFCGRVSCSAGTGTYRDRKWFCGSHSIFGSVMLLFVFKWSFKGFVELWWTQSLVLLQHWKCKTLLKLSDGAVCTFPLPISLEFQIFLEDRKPF